MILTIWLISISDNLYFRYGVLEVFQWYLDLDIFQSRTRLNIGRLEISNDHKAKEIIEQLRERVNRPW